MDIKSDFFAGSFPKDLREKIGEQVDIWLDSCFEKAENIYEKVANSEKRELHGRKTLIKAYSASDYNILCFVYSGRVHKKAEPNLIVFFKKETSDNPKIIGLISPRDSEVNSSFLRSILEPIKLEDHPSTRWSKVSTQIVRNLTNTYSRFDRIANTIIASKKDKTWNLESPEHIMNLSDNQIDYILDVESDIF
jgi:hypothetical protein